MAATGQTAAGVTVGCDRVEALGGSLKVSGPRGEGALIDVQLPL
jgi:signal transduction histidine kinase